MENVVACSWRGDIIESRVRAHIAVVDTSGDVTRWVGDPDYVTYWRSSSKPIQALTLVESGAVDAYGFTEEELAVICASHNGEDFHTDAVRSILSKSGLTEGDLQCGSHPVDRSFFRRDLPADAHPKRIHSNCSGKHAGMLAASKYNDWPTESYRNPDHPLQKENLKNLAELADYPAPDIRIGTDGCGVPVFSMPVKHIALAFARFANPEDLPPTRKDALARLRDAMITYPHMVGGTKRFDSDLMKEAGGSVVCKGGAAALHAMGLPGKNLGIAIKIEDADASHIAPCAMAVLGELDVLSDSVTATLQDYRGYPPYINTHDEVVGHTETTLSMESV